MDYVEGVRRVGLAMEEFLMLQRKYSSKDNSSNLKKKDKKRMHQEEGDQREDKPKDHGSGGKSRPKKPNKEYKTKGQTPVHTDKKKALQGIVPPLVEAQFEKSECARCGMDNYYAWKFCQKSILSSSSKGKRPKPKDDHPKDVSSTAGAGGDKRKAQVTASRRVYELDSNDEMIMD